MITSPANPPEMPMKNLAAIAAFIGLASCGGGGGGGGGGSVSSASAPAAVPNAPTAQIYNINSNGVVFNQSAVTGCVINGQISTINTTYNAYAVNFTYSSCRSPYAIWNGTQASGLMTVDDTVSPNRIYLGAQYHSGGVTYATYGEALKPATPPAAPHGRVAADTCRYISEQSTLFNHRTKPCHTSLAYATSFSPPAVGFTAC
ncbi:MAG: hypothetical protein FGM43_08245 [Sinobacteraceae bacterium]|nr:hypothetical protein [Nevskiaceae bacterium]